MSNPFFKTQNIQQQITWWATHLLTPAVVISNAVEPQANKLDHYDWCSLWIWVTSLKHFLQAEGCSAAKIHCRMSKAYRDIFMTGAHWFVSLIIKLYEAYSRDRLVHIRMGRRFAIL